VIDINIRPSPVPTASTAISPDFKASSKLFELVSLCDDFATLRGKSPASKHCVINIGITTNHVPIIEARMALPFPKRKDRTGFDHPRLYSPGRNFSVPTDTQSKGVEGHPFGRDSKA
jgi:hypothetical protein